MKLPHDSFAGSVCAGIALTGCLYLLVLLAIHGG